MELFSRTYRRHYEGQKIKKFKMFLPEEDGAFRNNIEKKPQNPRPKLKKCVCYTFTDNICSACNLVQVVFF